MLIDGRPSEKNWQLEPGASLGLLGKRHCPVFVSYFGLESVCKYRGARSIIHAALMTSKVLHTRVTLKALIVFLISLLTLGCRLYSLIPNENRIA